MTPSTEAAMREAFEAWATSNNLPVAFDGKRYTYADVQWLWLGYRAGHVHASAEMEKVRRIVATAPDLNLKDYSKGQVEKLVRALQHVYALVADEPPSLRGDERATIAEPQPTGAGETQ